MSKLGRTESQLEESRISNLDQKIIDFLTSYAYQPELVLIFVLCILVACSFGFPLPEEVTIIAVGLVVFIGRHPEQFPPPYPEAQSLSLWFAASFTFVVIWMSDYLVYNIGRFFGPHLAETKWFKRTVPDRAYRKIQYWMRRYGYWSIALFRFLPGIRFPGHLACGMLRVKPIHFLSIDGLAALVSVPTQIILIGYFGDYIFDSLTEIKMLLLFVAVVAVAVFLYFRFKK